jgi:outer membrane protein
MATQCHAQSLSELLALALGGEPTYLEAKTGIDTAKAKADQAFGALLPQVTASVGTHTNNRDYVTRSSTVPEAKDRYNSHSTQVNLTQPIWNYANYVGLQQAKNVLAQANYQLAAAEQDLFAKLVTAWFDVLAARDSVQFTAQQVSAAQKQWEVVRRGAELEIGSLPQVEEARAKLDQAIADAATAETDLRLKFSALEKLAGTLQPFDLPFIRDDAVLADLSGDRLETWLNAVEAGNPNILAALRAFETAVAEVSKQQAGHYPTVDLVGSYGTNSQTVGGFPGQAGYDITQGSIGLQLNIPLFSGGTQSAKVVEAQSQKEKARLEIENAKRTALLAFKQDWYGWQAARARAQAGVQGIKAAQAALAVAHAGIENNLKTELDVLQAEQQLRAAQRDFRKGRYDQLVAYVRLKSTAGQLTAEDVGALDALMIAADHPPEALPKQTPNQAPSAPPGAPTQRIYRFNAEREPLSFTVSAVAMRYLNGRGQE